MTQFIFNIYLFVMVGRPQEYLPFLEALRPAFVLGIVNALALIMSNETERIRDILGLSESKKYLLFYVIMIIGIPFAEYSRWQALEFALLRYSGNIVFFFVFILANSSFERLRKSIFVMIISIMIYGGVCACKGELIGGRFYFGNMFDPNDLAYLFVSLLPISLYYLVNNVSNIKKGISLFTIGVSILVIVLSASRAGMITLLITFIIILYAINFSIKKKILVICMLIAVSIIFYDKVNIERLSTIFDIGEDYNITAEEGRLSIWKKGLQIMMEHPIVGVGVTYFPDAIGNIRLRMTDLVRARWQPAHNSFIQIGCELGLIGLIAFISLIIGCLKHFYVLSKSKGEDKLESELRSISRILFVSTIATSIGGFFLTQGYSTLFTLIFAFSATLRRLNKRGFIKAD